MGRRIGFALIAVMILTLSGAPLAQAKKVRNFWISNLDGKRFDSKKEKDPIVISFFFVGCVPCIKEIPRLHKVITGEFPKAALLFIDPLPDDGGATIREFSENLKVPSSYFYHDALGRLSKRFFTGEFVFPTILVIKNRTIVAATTGFDPAAESVIREALK